MIPSDFYKPFAQRHYLWLNASKWYRVAKPNMPKPRASIRRQYGAIPYTIDGSDRVRVALLTSRETQRWVIPKGWPMAKRSATAAARREVLEEGGLVGTIIHMKPIGHYRYSKRFPVGKVVTCRVAVFLLRVRRVLDVWPEQNQRLRAWFSPEIAAELVSEKGLSAILLKLTPTVLRLAREKSKGSV
jgi:8-oxo-dGTP pyrophosphatase MutT (NUDIX family)